ncbi:neutral zinc metallopeptidase [Nonomuraea sp. B19D2]|uniref:KPN_02809 family neutral zinc metallopeptidase n=1 Tax=Nonomuraea sp. B19D2 TaxID=3159561 RepID=UPI0032DBA462
MQFDDDAQLDPSQVEDVRAAGPQPGGGGCMLPIGGRGGGCLLLILAVAGMFLFGVFPSPFSGNESGLQGGGQQPSAPAGRAPTGDLAARCRTGADAEQSEDCRVVGTVNSIQSYWRQAFEERGRKTYAPAKTVLFSRAVNTACGTADSAVGPFYCPADRKVYLDLTFFNTLQRDFGAEGGPFAQAYVIAHEYGHHVQDLLGALDSGASPVPIELQADCYAGVWAHNAVKTGFYDKPFTTTEISEALDAAAAVGDDRIQQRTTGRIDPESFTHGSSKQRVNAFQRGYENGRPDDCGLAELR